MDSEHWSEEELGVPVELTELSRAIIGAAIAVHRELGPGYPEIAYERALAVEFTHRGIRFSRQHLFHLHYRGEVVGEGRLDFLIEDQVILELKAVDQIAQLHRAQVLAYQKATRHRLALLINFNVPILKDGIRRFAL